MKRVYRSGVLGVFAHLDTTLRAARRAEGLAFRDVRILSPVPRHEVVEAVSPRPSPVRFYSFAGALTGSLAGLGLAVFTGINMEQMAFRVGGKPVVAWPAYVVIGFELAVLFGAIATMVGFMIHAWLPRRAIRKSYQPRFTEDRFGVFVPGESDRWEEAKRLLEEAGAEEVFVEQV